MEILKLKEYKRNKDDYNDYKTNLHNLKELLKKNKKYECINDILDTSNNKKLYLYYLFFQNYEMWINITLENNNSDINIKSFIGINEKNDKKINMYSLLIHWLFYLYNEFIKQFNSIVNTNYSEINKIRHIFKDTNFLIVKFYKVNLLNTAQIFKLLHFSLFLIESNFEVKSYSDKIYNGKNFFLLKGMFFLLQEASTIIFNKINCNGFDNEKDAKDNIQYILSFIDAFQNNKEINSQINMMILINNNIILSFMNRLLDIIDVNIISKYEPKFEKKLLIFFSHFFKYNYKKSKIFNTFLNTLKKSFINLYNFENNKDKIAHDLFVNNFYTKLLKNIFYKKENSTNDISRPLFDSFYFNGFDSQISLNAQNNNFEKSSLFFSFYLSPVEGRNQYPLFVIQKDFDNKKNDLLSIYLTKVNTKNDGKNEEEEYYLYSSEEGKEQKLDKIPNIKSKTTYYIGLCFNLKKLIITICNKKEEIFSTEINKDNKLFAVQSITLSFGFYKKKENVFSGYFGPILMVKNPKNTKELNVFLSSVLKLESNYKNFIFLMNNSNYFSEIEINYQNSLNNNIDYKLDKIECLLYLIPETFKFFSDKSSVVNHFPNIDSICKIQREYNIYNLNITLVKNEQGIVNFIMDNGFNYICLLYEYIYQFAENYFNEESEKSQENYQNDLFIKMIVSIFKRTLFIIEKCYNEIIIQNFNKNLKQIYMNLFQSLIIICKNYSIMDNLINYFFQIIKYYHNYISDYINKKKDISDINNNIFKNNLSCINGWIDFLLTPNIYNYDKKNILMNLFKELSSYFNYIRMNKVTERINQHLFNRLLDFIPFLNNDYKDNINTDDDKNTINTINTINENKTNKNEKDVFDYYFNALKVFFENNLSKSENIMNLKSIFIVVNDYLSNNNHIFNKFNNFINDLIGNNQEMYFNDDKGNEQILLFINYTKKFFKNNIENQESSNEKEITNKKLILNQLLSILTRIIFTKQNIGKNDEIIREYRKLIERVEKASLILTISNALIFLINNILSDNKWSSSFNNSKKIYTYDDLTNLSNFYFQIFDLIYYFLEYDTNCDKKQNNLIDNEKVITESLKQISNLLKPKIENGKNWNYNEWPIIDLDKTNNYLDIIYILINFLKFYHHILFTKIVSEQLVLDFIEICRLCCTSSLIYSNILIQTEEDLDITKTPLEIILDTCIFYITLCLNKLSENSVDININLDIIIGEVNNIYALLDSILSKCYINSKKKKQKISIFYINDYFRLLSDNYPIEGKKRPKNDDIFKNFTKDFNNYQNLQRALINEEKFNFNFSTFFILKLNGYKNILIELCLKLSQLKTQEFILKIIGDLLTLISEKIRENYNEQEMLYSKDKNYYFKKSNTSYSYYTEIKRIFEANIKTRDYSEIDDFLTTIVFNQNFDCFYKSIYSGRCKKEKALEHKKSDYKINERKLDQHEFSSKNLTLNVTESKFEKIHSSDDLKKNFQESLSIESPDLTSPKEKEDLSMSQDEYELQIEEFSASEKNMYNTPLESVKDDLGINKYNINMSSFSSKGIKRRSSSYFSLSEHLELSSKKDKYSRKFSNSSDISTEKSNISNTFKYINYFNEPDEFYMNNAKKELMMTIFSVYFVDAFFDNDIFRIMKNYYLQKIEGVQKSTKLLDYPTKIKNFSNCLEPFLFFKPFSSFYINKTFPITHKYFNDYMKEYNINRYEPILLHRKILHEFNFEEKFDKKCELIKINHSYFGHIIGSKNINYIIFEQQKYDFYEKLSEIKNNNKSVDTSKQESIDLNEMFSLSFLNKKPLKNKRKISLNEKEKESYKQRKKYKKEKTIIILFDEIEEILERRFLLVWQAIEIYLKNGKSYFFNFLSEEESKSIIDIFKVNAITKDKIHERDFFKIYQKNLLSEWKEERLSTYEYLLFLNKYGSRTFNEVNQYPIFPWIIINYEPYDCNQIQIKYRNFRYPMAAQSEDNRNTALGRFLDDEENKVKFPVHYGTHYSTSSYIYFYLMREEPFTTLLVKLQGYKQENSNRMFQGVLETLTMLGAGSDNRECIPDLYCKIEQFINVNNADFGIKCNNERVDDFNLCLIEKNSSFCNGKYEISDYVNFIIFNKKLLDQIEVSSNINEWIDNIFGIGQIPENNMKESLNIFNKETYQQKTNVHNKLIKMKNKSKQQEEIIKKIGNKIELIISFGQTPYQIFNEKHQKKVIKKNEIEQNDDEEEEESFDFHISSIFWKNDIKAATDNLPIFFEINESIGKLFLIDPKRKLEIIDSNYYNIKENHQKHFYLKKIEDFELFHIKFFKKIIIQDNHLYYVIKPKYCFSSFKENYNINSDSSNADEYISYYNSYINSLNKPKLKKDKLITEEYIKFITCRYMDNSFKIHLTLKDKPKKDYKSYSFICEDFVSSCCTVSPNKFLIGLKNGKLIQGSIYKEKNNIKNKFDKQIQAHTKAINVIEINKRLGIIITAGEDNYVFIRKLYDLELITPIKIKTKYIITMAKISPMNFVYIMCFNKRKNKNKSIIFGFTLNGLYFAKSKYNYYDSLDFTKSGNIVTFICRKEIEILSADKLENILLNKENKDIKDIKNMNDVQNKINGASWIIYNYFSRRYEDEPIINKIITFSIFDKSKGENMIKAIDVTENKFFE